MATLVIEGAGEPRVAYDLNWGLTRVGRGPDNHIILLDPSVSYHHCEFELGLDFLKVRDCASTNGTFVAGRSIAEALLNPGDLVRLGQVSGEVEWSNEPVVVPRLEAPRLPESVPLAQGGMSCRNHREVRSLWHCPKCRQYFCLRCIRGVNLVGRSVHKLCPLCSGHVELAPWAMPDTGKPSLWSRVKKVLSRTSRLK